MKKINKLNTLLLVTSALCVFNITKFNSVHAEASALNAGAEVAISGVNGNLNNINMKFEFTSSVNLDGTNNALLVGLTASDGTLLTDARFIGAATQVGVFDKNNVALSFGSAPSAIGKKSAVESNFKYTFESRDFAVVNNSKDIAKLVVVGQKGAAINADISVSEVKYSVKFGDETAIEYSYNAKIADPLDTSTYQCVDVDNHKPITGWAGDDSSTFVSGSTYATKDIVYSVSLGSAVAHSWGSEIAEVAATEQANGTKAHYKCSDCGAIKLDGALANASDLVIPMLGHTHNYEASFVWGETANTKPTVTYTCKSSWCKDTHVMDAADITLTEESKNDSTCAQVGSVTYKASCTYATVLAEDTKEYEIAKKAHTPGTHHDAKAQSLTEDGNIEYWECSVCHGNFSDAACTNPVSETVLPKYTLEEAQVVSLLDLTGKTFALLNNEDYSYEFTKPNKSTSIQFAWKVNSDTVGDRIRIHNNFCGTDKWNATCSAWFVLDQDKVGVMDNGSQRWVSDVEIGIGLHSIELTTQAIMNGEVPTGNYLVTVKLDGNVVDSMIQAYDASKMASKIFVNSSGTDNYLYDITYTGETYEEAEEINVYDLYGLGSLTCLNSEKQFSYTTDSENHSRIFKYKLTLNSLTDKSEFFVDLGTDNACRVWVQPGGDKNLFFAWQLDGHWTDRYYINGRSGANNASSIEVGTTYDVEMGRIRIDSGLYKGKDIVYIKVNGKYLYNYHQPSWFYVDPESDKGYPITVNKVGIKAVNYTVKDVNYVEPKFEEADIISINDLMVNGEYVTTGKADIYTVGLNKYSYVGNSTYGSVIFKGVFNFTEGSFTNSDVNGTQFRFDDAWSDAGMIWIHPDGFLIYDGAHNKVVGSKLTLGQDVNVEIGRLAVLNDDDSFAGKHYYYVKCDGVIAAEYVDSTISEEVYSKKVVSFTGKSGDNGTNEGNEIKNFEIKKTVTIKVGDSYSTTVEVTKSGLITLPEFGTEVVPADKRIVGWKVEGTDKAFQPKADRITEDITIVAKVDDFKLKVTFGNQELYFSNGAEVVPPAKNPTKAFDNENHYVFDKWVDSDDVEFASGTIASNDIEYTAKFNAIPHVYGEWATEVEPGCTTVGQKKKVCSCGHAVYEEIPAAHKAVKVDAVAATCTTDGNIEYYECSVCQKKYSDANCTKELSDVVVKAHGLKHYDEKEATCTKKGNIEYWECETCNKLYKDAEAKEEVSDVTTPTKHDLTKVEAKAATCEEDGNIEYYHCSECGKNFDKDGKQLTSVKVISEGHSYGDDHKCSVCGQEDPNYVPEDPNKDKPKNIFSGCFGGIGASLFTIGGLLATVVALKRKKTTIQ